MKHYLSFGGGVNSVALYLLMEQLSMDFEAVFVDHGADYPETYGYINYFKSTGRNITVLKPCVSRPFGNGRKEWHSLIDFCRDRKLIPLQWPRWCTGDFKKDIVSKYVRKPCWMHIGIDAGEAHRAAKTARKKGKIEYRWLLIDHGIDRQGCKDLIIKAGLKVPPKSGCFICPFQKRSQWKRLRKEYPDLFCIAQELEEASGRTYNRSRIPLAEIVSDR